MEEAKIRELIKENEGFVEANLKKSEGLSIDFEGKDLKTIKNRDFSTLTVRFTLPDGRTGTASSYPPKPEETLRIAKKQAKVSEKDPDFSGIPPKSSYPEVEKRKINLTRQELVENSQEFVNSVKNAKLQDASTSLQKSNSFFINSNGAELKKEISTLSASLSLKKGRATATERKVSRERFNFVALADKGEALCLKSTSPEQGKTQRTNLLLDYFALSSLISNTLVPAINAENIYRGRSFLRGKLGKKVFSDKLTLTDNGRLEGGLLTREGDAEGYPSQATPVIEEGVVKNFLYDYYTAKREGKKSTGNCGGISGRPVISPSNLVIEGGEEKREEIIDGLKEGVIITRVKGAHTINPVSGDFSLGVENAFRIEEGELVPIKEIMISGNAFEMFRKISKVGRVPRQEGNLKSPCILFKNMQVVG